jgi:hypothetical protein
MREIHGRPVDDEQVDAWVAEAEAGYPVDELRRRANTALLTKIYSSLPAGLTSSHGWTTRAIPAANFGLALIARADFWK